MFIGTPLRAPFAVLPLLPLTSAAAAAAAAAAPDAVAFGENDPALQRQVDLRVEAAVKEVLLKHDLTRPPNTTKAYVPKQKEWKEWTSPSPFFSPFPPFFSFRFAPASANMLAGMVRDAELRRACVRLGIPPR